MKHSKWIVGLTTGALAVVALAWLFRPRPIPVETATVERGAFTLTVEEDGITRVRDRYVVTTPVAGLLLRPTLRAGARVARGEVVAVIVPNAAQMLDARTRLELGAQVESSAARASRARSLMRQTEAAALQAESEHRRLEELGAQGFASQTERERSGLTLELRRKDAEAARFEADAAEHDLQQARAALRQGDPARDAGRNSWSLRAPVDGVVLAVREENETALGVGAPVLDIADVRRLEARIDVLSTEATRIRENAFVELDAGDVRLAGRVRRIEPSGYTKVSALGIEEQRVDVLVDLLPNPASLERVGDGYRVDAAIEIAREENVLRIPLSALFRHGQDWATFRVVGDRARLTAVRIGQRGQELATVLGGLEDGAVVIEYPSDAVRDGARVHPRPKSAAGGNT
jgi:HlyD family secretion protein